MFLHDNLIFSEEYWVFLYLVVSSGKWAVCFRCRRAGVATLVIGTAVTYYCTLILSGLWDWNEPNRYVRYRDLGRSIYGKHFALVKFCVLLKSVQEQYYHLVPAVIFSLDFSL